MRVISLKISEATLEAINTRASHLRWSRSEVLRAAVEDYLRQGPGSSSKTFLEAAGDLVGSADGPPDLSTNPDYLFDLAK